MNQTKVCLFTLAVIVAICFAAQLVEAGKKGDLIVVGGEKGCGPKLLLKTGKKGKGNVLVMNPCKKKEEHYNYVPYPVYGGHEESYGDHGGYDMSHDDGGYGDHGGY